MQMVLVVGAGFTGSAAARLLAEAGHTVEVWERQQVVGGASYDEPDENGVLVHRHGPHIFHTNSEEAHAFASRFTSWNGYGHRVLGSVGGKLCPIPFNYTSIEQCFDAETAQRYQRKLAELVGEGGATTIGNLRQAEDGDLKDLAEFVYENVFLHYTEKQWGMSPQQLGGGVMDRVPVRASREDRYFTDAHQGMPGDGFTAMMEKMLDHPNIHLRLGVDAETRLRLLDKKIFVDGAPFDGQVVYTGCLAALQENRFGRLPYRTLRLETAVKAHPFQPAAVVNYPGAEEKFTRISEFANFYPEKPAKAGTIMHEYPLAYEGQEGLHPYYPVPLEENQALYQKYLDAVAEVPGFVPAGRLGCYRYINMDAAILDGLRAAKQVG